MAVALILSFAATAIVACLVGIILGRVVFHRHKWSKWVFYKDTLYYGKDRDIPVGRAKVYTRVCEGCGLPETREIDA